ncbi:MAG: sigma-70 family RNA polymerase sigma factor [Candidatus Dadabacteria bacterium]|nr:sigma-70 family RNA polymerase sigma factor [Candidatus Dadabacteria bacterium]NIQ14538.1 sigma-70 family RNA polymerase sigma factor [Candidatus Dadabacteria bacterium]
MLALRKLIQTMLIKCGNLYSYYKDEKLINIYLQQNDECAYEELVNRYLDRIFSLVYRIVKDVNVSEDVVQEIFLTLSEKLHTFKGNSSFSTWIYRVSTNAALMKLRTEKKHKYDYTLVDEKEYDENYYANMTYQATDSKYRPDLINYKKESFDLLEKSINNLSENYRVVIHLKDIEGMSIREISEILDISIQAVKSRIHRARLELKSILENQLFEWSK